MEDFINKARGIILAGAESADAWRLAPRMILLAYGGLVFKLVDWFFAIPTYSKTVCDAAVMKILIDAKIPLDQAQTVACTVVDVVGGPTTTHTVLVTTICSLATVVIGLYHNSSKDWSKSFVPWNFGLTKKEINDKKDKQPQ